MLVRLIQLLRILPTDTHGPEGIFLFYHPDRLHQEFTSHLSNEVHLFSIFCDVYSLVNHMNPGNSQYTRGIFLEAYRNISDYLL
jgi:hypothetical protein